MLVFLLESICQTTCATAQPGKCSLTLCKTKHLRKQTLKCHRTLCKDLNAKCFLEHAKDGYGAKSAQAKKVTYLGTYRTLLEHRMLGLNTSTAQCGEITWTYHSGQAFFAVIFCCEYSFATCILVWKSKVNALTAEEKKKNGLLSLGLMNLIYGGDSFSRGRLREAMIPKHLIIKQIGTYLSHRCP